MRIRLSYFLFTLLIVVLCLAPTSAQHHQNCYYVNSNTGLNVRLHPNTDGQPFHVLKYGDVLTIKGSSFTLDSIVQLIENDTADWIPIGFNNIHDGYVLDSYVSRNLKTIPITALSLFYRVYTGEFDYLRQESPKRYEKSNQSCYSYYEETYIREGEYVSKEERQQALDTLNKYLDLKLVDIGEYIKKKVDNPYKLDKSFKVKRTLSNDNRNRFFLPINSGSDSVLIEDQLGEAYVSKTYLGEVKKLNQYVIQSYYESPSTYFIDKKTGVNQAISLGTPYISPKGKYVISFYESPTYNYDNACVLTVGLVNAGEETANIPFNLMVEYKSWLPALDKDEYAFWVSDTELVMKVFPIDNRINPPEENDGRPYFQYLKVRIK